MGDSNKKEFDICIIGAGIMGGSIARELSQYDKTVLVLEADARVGMETTSGNSGLVHGGFDPTPGKLNAKLNVLGKKRYEDWIKDMDFPYIRIDSTVVAFNDEEMEEVHKLYDRGLENGLDPKELEIIDTDELHKREPNISPEVKGALICNSSIALDPVELTKVLFKNAIKNGVVLEVNSKVEAIEKTGEIFSIKTSKNETYQAKVIINAAGHYADVIASLAGYPDFELTTRRGEYRILEKSERHIVNSVIFMVPTIHGKGVIVAPLLDGHIMVGPTSEDGVPKEDTRLVTEDALGKIAEIGKRLIPNIKMEKTCMTYAGSRPIYAKTDDFYIEPAKADKNFINVAGTKSPGISSAPAIADLVIELVKPCFPDLAKKSNWDPIEKSILPLT